MAAVRAGPVERRSLPVNRPAGGPGCALALSCAVEGKRGGSRVVGSRQSRSWGNVVRKKFSPSIGMAW
jgi:hypothetical protein